MNVSLDTQHGLLSLHAGFAPDESFASNVVVGDVVLDISTKGRVRGIEILDLKRFLDDFHVAHRIDDITSASFHVDKREESVLLTITFITTQDSFPARLAVSLQPAVA